MKCLLIERAPITFAWGFLETTLGRAAQFFLEWRRDLGVLGRSEPVRGSLASQLLAFESLTMPPTLELLISTSSDWVAWFDNSATTADPASPMSYAARELGCRSIAITNSPQREAADGNVVSYGAVQLQVFGPQMTDFLNVQRSISAMNDGGRWTFSTGGEVQPYERPERYRARRIADRFTPDMLEEYVTYYGICLFDPNFYGPDGFLIERKVAHPGRSVSLGDAQRRLVL